MLVMLLEMEGQSLVARIGFEERFGNQTGNQELTLLKERTLLKLFKITVQLSNSHLQVTLLQRKNTITGMIWEPESVGWATS